MNSEHLLLESSQHDRSLNQGVARIVERNIDSIVRMRLDAECEKVIETSMRCGKACTYTLSV